MTKADLPESKKALSVYSGRKESAYIEHFRSIIDRTKIERIIKGIEEIAEDGKVSPKTRLDAFKVLLDKAVPDAKLPVKQAINTKNILNNNQKYNVKLLEVKKKGD